MKIKCLGMSEREEREVIKIILAESFHGDTAKPLATIATKSNPTTMTPQPISTAPSGQRILLYSKRPIDSEGWWQIGMMCPHVRRWIDDDCEPDWMLVQPSFWLPLPQPPQPQ
jgi:hypothetical protein